MNDFVSRFLFVVLLLIIFSKIADVLVPYDSTDHQVNGEVIRSGMSIKVDGLTGCHYLVYGGFFRGGMAPRMDASGNQICSGLE